MYEGPNTRNYHTYILTNYERTVLYVGMTNDLLRRLNDHLKDSKNLKNTFAGKYNCLYLVHYEWYQYVLDAIAREKEIKGWSRLKKEKLIEENNPDWKFLNEEIEPDLI